MRYVAAVVFGLALGCTYTTPGSRDIREDLKGSRWECRDLDTDIEFRFTWREVDYAEIGMGAPSCLYFSDSTGRKRRICSGDEYRYQCTRFYDAP